jgi:SagB-type dehydrogenase family enzyme
MVNFSADTVLLSLADDVALASAGPGVVDIRRGARTIRLKRLDRGVEAALQRLSEGPASGDELEKIATSGHAAADLSRLAGELARLTGKSLIRLSCTVAGEELLCATAHGALADFDFGSSPANACVRLSRFAYLHRVGSEMIIDSPASHARVTLCASFLGGLIAALARPRSVGELGDDLPGCDPAAVQAAVRFLLGVGVIAVADESGEIEYETRATSAQREFHDVVLHTASRRGLTGQPVGATYRFRGSIPPSPAVRPLPEGARISLPRPDIDRLMAEDPPLARVMETRRSIRAHGTEPITIGQLGEFLFRVARLRSVREIDELAGRRYESSDRTYPSGGATYDLELYLTIRCCTGLAPAIYHYDPLEHQLTEVCRRPDLVRSMLLEAFFSTGGKCRPQVVITLASRFARLAWKYQGLSYALTLKNAGVLYEAMYLVATAMGLAPCGAGCGDSAVFSEATGLDPLVESSVGEFMLGTREQD